MRRRQFVHGLAGLAAAGLVMPAFARRKRPRVGIVGGGIVGASIALRLAQGGADVLQFEKTAPAAGATRNSFGWLNAFVTDPHYQALRLRSIAAYHEIDGPLDLGITWGGYLNWARDQADTEFVRANAKQMAGTPFPVRDLSAAEFAALTPSLEPGSVTAAIYSGLDGHIDPVRATLSFLEHAKRIGARMVCPCEVQSLEFQGGHLRSAVTSAGTIALDRLVVAAGVDTPKLLAMAGYKLQLRHAPGFLAHSRPAPMLTQSICDAPGGVEFKQTADGTLVGTDSPEPPDLPVHVQIREYPVDFPDEGLRTWHGTRALDKIKAFAPAARDVPLDHVTLGFRPMPTDGLPIVGAVPGAPDLYVVVTHSGVTLAPLLGQYVRAELLGGNEIAELAPYRPGRFAQG